MNINEKPNWNVVRFCGFMYFYAVIEPLVFKRAILEVFRGIPEVCGIDLETSSIYKIQ